MRRRHVAAGRVGLGALNGTRTVSSWSLVRRFTESTVIVLSLRETKPLV